MINENLQKGPEETELAYIWRLGRARENGLLEMTWEGLAEVFNRNLREPDEYMTESAYRKKYSVMRQAYDEVFKGGNGSDELAELREERYELYKERVRLGDERRELNSILRSKAREEGFLERVERIFAEHKYEPLEISYFETPKIDSNVDMLIPLTDLHAGIVIDNAWNKYDFDVLKSRLFSYYSQIKMIQERHMAKRAYVIGSEFISGIIHSTLRIESNDNVIQQFVKCMNNITWFLIQLSSLFEEVDFYVAPGNHSRIFPKKEENAKGENLDHLALYYLKGYLQNVENVIFNENNLDEGIVFFEVRGNKVFSVHGDKDSPENVCRHLTELTGIVPDIVVLGHRHTNAMYSANGGCKVIQSGSFSGIDNYCVDNRLRGRPEQTVCVVGDNGLECVYDVRLD